MGKTLGYGEITVANVTEPFTVMLTNEAQQFATDSNRKVTSAQSYYTDIIVIRGSQERTDYTIGNITSGSGITVSKSSKRVTFSVSAGTTIGADTGVIEIPITLDGQTVKKQFSWSCGKQGPQGVQGNDGNSFAWNMLSETNCGKKHWGTESSGGKYSVEDFITEDNINAVKLICTEGISTSNWSYVLFKDIKMLKQLKPSTKYTLSYDIKANRSGAISHSICKGDVSNFCTNTVVVNNIIGNDTWQHISVVLTTNDLKTTPTNEILYLGRNALSKVGYSIIKNLKLVEGDIDTPWSPSQSDIEGKGVVETVQYYLATSQASGVTSSTSGWSTDITTQKLTADKKYLWNCYQTKYSDGTSEPISTPKVIGVYGDKGQTGEDGQDGAGFHWNLLKYSGDLSKQVLGGAGTYTATVESIEDKTTPSGQAEKITYTVQGTGGKFIQTGKYIKEGNIKQGKTYTVSVWCKCSSIKSTGVINAEFLDNKTYVNPTLSTEWQQYVVTGVANKDVTSTSSASAISFYYNDNMSVGDIFYISSPKVEEGDKASPWCTTYEETLAKNLSITPSSQYFKSTDGGKTFTPDTITIKPTIQGEISFGKWQYSIDGGVSFADIVSGQKGLTINNNVLTVSKDSSLYSDAVTMVTFRAVANDSSFYDTCSIAKIYDVSDIGDGRNLLTGVSSYTKDTPFEKTDSRADGWTMYQNIITSIELEAGKKYVLQAKTDGNWAANHDTNGQDPSKKLVTLWLCSDKTNNCFDMRQGYAVFTPTVTAKYKLRVNQYSNGTDAYTIHLWDIKLEKGSSPTGWTPAPEDLQTAILSTKSEISDVSLKVDNNKQAIEQRVEKTTYQQDLNLVKGDISKANEGLNKWRYEIYPKSLFASEYQGKSTMDVFAKNTNLTPSQSVLINDTDFGKSWAYGDNYIGYALTFVKFSAAKSIAITFKHDDGAHLYLNGKLIGGDDTCNTGSGESLTLSFIQGWNCLEVVLNEKSGSEYIGLGTTISAISECQLMNCYYGTPVARQSHITNQLVENTTNIKGISTKVSKVTSVIGDNGENFTSFQNDYSDFKQTMNGFKTTVGQTYVTKDDFNGLEIGGRNLLLYSQTIRAHKDYYGVGWLTDEVETFNGCPVWSVKNQWGRLTWLFKSHVIDRGLVKVGDTLTYSLYAKTNNASGKSINCSYRFKGNANAYWFNGSAFNVGTNWTRYSVTFTITKDMLATDTYMTEIGFEETASMSGDDKVYYACPKLERGTKATDYTPALEDNEINGQNLVSNLSSNWEQGSVSYVANSTYASIKTVLATRLRTEDVFSVSGNVTISAGTSTNSSKEELNFYYVLFDVNKKAIGVPASGSEWQSLTSPKIINCGDAKYMAIILRWGSGSTVITPSNISQICLKIERGTSATPFTLAPEDVNGKIVNVETIANQTAKKFEWIVKGGDSSSNFTLTDRVADLVAERINFKGLVTFSGTTNLIENSNMMNGLANITSECKAIKVIDDSTYRKALVITPIAGGRIFWGVANVWKANITYTVSFVAKSSVAGQKIKPSRSVADWGDEITLTTSYVKYTTRIKSTATADGGTLSFSFSNAIGDVTLTNVKLETGMNPTDWSPAPGDYITQASLVRNWTTNTTWINGGKIYTGSITADKIATDAIKSRNYISSGGTQGSFLNLSDGSFQSPNLSWDANGNLIAKNANLSGQITATKGSIAGWTIISNKMYTTGSGKYTGIGKYGSAYAFWAGATSNDNGNSAVFKVGHTGKLTATDADITGTITATNGKIGRYDITSTYLMTNSGSNASGIGGNQAFWSGAEDSNSAPFRVGYDGVLWAENAAIRGSIETGNLGDEGDTVSIINGHIGIQGTSNNVEIYSTGFKFGIDGDYYLMSVSEGVKCYRNLYATDFVADGWLYCSEVHSSGAVVIGADSESFYWAHGYQIARGTSWGGVCVGDDSQQLRLYGSSIWASHSISTSDENLKENFTTLDQYENFYMNLNPIGFNYIGDYDGKKTHFGFGAHKTEDVLESEGYDADKFAVVTHRPLVQEDIEKRFGKDVEVDIETEYGVSYTEFIALNTHMIQKTRRELTKVKQEKADLEVRLQAIEAKLGL